MRQILPMTTTVTESDQVSIPPDIAREFGIHPDTKLEWAKGSEGVITLKLLLRRGELARQLLGAGSDANAGHLGGVEQSARRGGKCGITVDPPNPDVRIEDNHPAASQSASATGSVGASSLTGVPRSG